MLKYSAFRIVVNTQKRIKDFSVHCLPYCTLENPIKSLMISLVKGTSVFEVANGNMTSIWRQIVAAVLSFTANGIRGRLLGEINNRVCVIRETSRIARAALISELSTPSIIGEFNPLSVFLVYGFRAFYL